MTYTKDQEARIQQINQAAKDLINLLITCPDYMKPYLPAPLITLPIKDTLPTIVADAVANLLSQHDYTVFFPNHVELEEPAVEYISDHYESEEQMEQHIERLLNDQLQ